MGGQAAARRLQRSAWYEATPRAVLTPPCLATEYECRTRPDLERSDTRHCAGRPVRGAWVPELQTVLGAPRSAYHRERGVGEDKYPHDRSVEGASRAAK